MKSWMTTETKGTNYDMVLEIWEEYVWRNSS